MLMYVFMYCCVAILRDNTGGVVSALAVLRVTLYNATRYMYTYAQTYNNK